MRVEQLGTVRRPQLNILGCDPQHPQQAPLAHRHRAAPVPATRAAASWACSPPNPQTLRLIFLAVLDQGDKGFNMSDALWKNIAVFHQVPAKSVDALGALTHQEIAGT